MICAKYLVYSLKTGLLQEVREKGSTGPDRVWNLCHVPLPSVYMRELKSEIPGLPTTDDHACNPCTSAS